MIEIYVHHLCHNKDKYSLDQLITHCLHILSADRLFAVTLLQSMTISLTLIHTHSRVVGCRSCHTLQPR